MNLHSFRNPNAPNALNNACILYEKSHLFGQAARCTLARAAELGVTNDYVERARENLSRYLPNEFRFSPPSRVALEWPQ